MGSKKFLKVENIKSGYSSKEIIHGISFEADKHSITCLLGANGSGKTTLLKCLCSLHPHEGKTILKTEELEKLSLKERAKRISYISQTSGIEMSISVLDVVLMGFNPTLSLLQRPSLKQINLAKDALAYFKLESYAQRDYITLSGGEKQLVIMARMMVENSLLLLLDEPDSALDFNNRHTILKTIAEIVKKEEKACVLCLHDPILSLQYCDQILLIKDGLCVACIYPQIDSVEIIEDALSKIYGNIKVEMKIGKNNKRMFHLFLEEE